MIDIINVSSIQIMGIATRTSNKKEATPDGLIVPLHDQFMRTQLSEGIIHKKDDRIIALYTDYESDESGEYTYAIGHQVRSVEDCPEVCDIFHIEGGKYLRYPTERGFMRDVLPQAWREIWRRTQDGTLGATRAYRTDFEFHNYEDAASPDVQIDIYLSVED